MLATHAHKEYWPYTPHAAEKARWGKDGGLGGKDYQNAFPLERLGPLAQRGFPSPRKNH